MANRDYRHLVLVIDRSGSINLVLQDMQGGYDAFIADQKQITGVQTTVSLYEFDTEHDTVCEMTPVNTMPRYRIRPRGGTALLDAVGFAITRTSDRIAGLPEAERPDKVIVMIATDGRENSSREYTKPQVKNLIGHHERDHGWAFVYVGAHADAFAEAGGIGVAGASTLKSGSSGQAVLASWMSSSSMVSRGTAGGLSAGGQSAGVYEYTQDERDAATDQ